MTWLRASGLRARLCGWGKGEAPPDTMRATLFGGFSAAVRALRLYGKFNVQDNGGGVIVKCATMRELLDIRQNRLCRNARLLECLFKTRNPEFLALAVSRLQHGAAPELYADGK